MFYPIRIKLIENLAKSNNSNFRERRTEPRAIGALSGRVDRTIRRPESERQLTWAEAWCTLPLTSTHSQKEYVPCSCTSQWCEKNTFYYCKKKTGPKEMEHHFLHNFTDLVCYTKPSRPVGPIALNAAQVYILAYAVPKLHNIHCIE